MLDWNRRCEHRKRYVALPKSPCAPNTVLQCGAPVPGASWMSRHSNVRPNLDGEFPGSRQVCDLDGERSKKHFPSSPRRGIEAQYGQSSHGSPQTRPDQVQNSTDFCRIFLLKRGISGVADFHPFSSTPTRPTAGGLVDRTARTTHPSLQIPLRHIQTTTTRKYLGAMLAGGRHATAFTLEAIPIVRAFPCRLSMLHQHP